MTEYEIEQKIENKKKEIKKFEKIKKTDMSFYIFLITINFVYAIGCIIGGSFMISTKFAILGAFALMCGIGLFITYCICSPMIIKRKKNAPHNIKKLKSQIKELEYELSQKKTKISKIENDKKENINQDLNSKNEIKDNIDLLVKYKELLDNGTISQEEFDKKKKEILG